MTQNGNLLKAQMFPVASFGRKDGLIYLLSSAVLPKSGESQLDSSDFQARSVEALDRVSKQLATQSNTRLNSNLKTVCDSAQSKLLLPSHAFEIFNDEAWESLRLHANSLLLQVTAGPELIHLKMNLLKVLDLGFNLQIWFDDPKQYRELYECWQSLYPEQIFLCFLPSKNFAYESILNFQIQENFQVLFLPKKSQLDANLNFEEVLKLKLALCERQLSTQVLILPEQLTSLRPEEQEFYHDISYDRLENVLIRKNKTLFIFLIFIKILKKFNLLFFMDLLKQSLLLFAKPTWQSVKALLDLSSSKGIHLVGSLRVISVRCYWLCRKVFAVLKLQLWEFHRGPYQYLWRWRLSLYLFLNRSFWRGYRLLFIVGIEIFEFVRSFPSQMSRLFWIFHRGPYQVFWMLHRGFWMFHRGPYQVFWKTRAGFFFVCNMAFWRIYNYGVRLFFATINFGIETINLIRRGAWAFHRGPFQLVWKFRILLQNSLIFVFWKCFSWLYQLSVKIFYFTGSLPGRLVLLYWSLHRGPYQMAVRSFLFCDRLLVGLFWKSRAMINRCFLGLKLGYWKVFWIVTQAKAIFGTSIGNLKISFEIFAIKLFWSVYSLFLKLLGISAWTFGYLKFIGTLCYWRILVRVWYVIRFPVFKVYWFVSFQIRKRLFKREAVS